MWTLSRLSRAYVLTTAFGRAVVDLLAWPLVLEDLRVRFMVQFLLPVGLNA